MFFGPHKMKMSHYFISLWYPLELWTFPNWNLWLFWFFDDPPFPYIWTISQVSQLFGLESFPYHSDILYLSAIFLKNFENILWFWDSKLCLAFYPTLKIHLVWGKSWEYYLVWLDIKIGINNPPNHHQPSGTCWTV